MGERYLDTVEVGSSILPAPTIPKQQHRISKALLRRGVATDLERGEGEKRRFFAEGKTKVFPSVVVRYLDTVEVGSSNPRFLNLRSRSKKLREIPEIGRGPMKWVDNLSPKGSTRASA